jgi:hypothetical protein
MKPAWLRIALINFAVAAVLALLLRLVHLADLSWIDYRFVRHAHSHVAMLGWAYMVMYALIWHRFVPQEKRVKEVYTLLFWITQLSVVGMMISFPLQGYGLASIIFTTLHLFLSYAFVGLVWVHLPKDRSKSGLLLKTSFVWMLLSTAGLWALAIIMANGIRTPWYYTAIQFFLHFQFNGWFTFSAIALFFIDIEKFNVVTNKQLFLWFFVLLVVSCLLTFALSVAWSNPLPSLYFLNGLGVLIQLAALILFAVILKGVWNSFSGGKTNIVKAFYLLAFGSFALKIVIQSIVVIPEVAVISYTIRQFVVGFIHLTMLGSLSCFVLALLYEHYHAIFSSKVSLLGGYAFMATFIATEAILFVQGLMLWAALGFAEYYYEALFIATGGLVIGIIMMAGGLKTKLKN